jgi:hypothetical protein
MKKMNLCSIFAASIALVIGVAFTSCSKNNNDSSNNGKVDPSTIATTSLVAYFPFDGTGNEMISSIMPKAYPNVTYVTGRRGQAFQGVDNAYFLYDLPTGNKLKSLKAFSVAMWLYEGQIPQSVDPVPMMLQIKNDDDLFWGNLSLTQDRMPTASIDSLNLKTVFHKEGAPNANKFIGFANPAYQASKWMHIIYEYDNVTSTYSVFVNGVKLKVPNGGDVVNSLVYTDGTHTTLLGDLVFNKASQLVIGGWLTKIQGSATDAWMGWFNGKMDELRIYDRALTAVEAKALYDAEVSQL